jgi:cytochrome c-type biogenesis protein CcmH
MDQIMTFVFWCIAGMLTALVLGPLLWPLLKRREPSQQAGDGEYALSVYHQQFAELEQDLKSGVLADEQYQQSKWELERRLLEETGAVKAAPVTGRWSVNNRVIGMALAIVIPAASGVLYWTLGNQEAIVSPTVSTPMTSGGLDNAHQTSEGLDTLSERLRKRLEQSPDDGVGWALLARSYVEIGRHADAVPIYEKAVKLIPDDPQMLADYADALGMLQGRRLAGKPEQLIQQALKIDPNHAKALMLAGTVAFDRKEFSRAVQYWERANANLPADAEREIRQELLSGIAEAKGLAGGTAMPAKVSDAAPKPAKPSGGSRSISGTVRLAPGFAAKESQIDILFVFARAVDGPPMPVAIVRTVKSGWPFSFRLDDSNSPMPARKLSGAGEVVIVARLSKSGEAMPKRGDLQGVSRPVRPGASGIDIVIDQEIP